MSQYNIDYPISLHCYIECFVIQRAPVIVVIICCYMCCYNMLLHVLLYVCVVSSGMLAFQGNDEQGVFIRTNLKKMGVTPRFIKGTEYSSIHNECETIVLWGWLA